MHHVFGILVILVSLFSCQTRTSPTLEPGLAIPNPTNPPFRFRYLFTAHLEFGQVANEEPILIPGGVQFVVPITGGSVTGPAGNGTITGGTAYGHYYNNATYQLPKVAIYGQLNGTNGTTPFFVEENGVNTNVTHATKISINTAGEEYRYIREGFVLARRYMAVEGTYLDAVCYLVEDS